MPFHQMLVGSTTFDEEVVFGELFRHDIDISEDFHPTHGSYYSKKLVGSVIVIFPNG